MTKVLISNIMSLEVSFSFVSRKAGEGGRGEGGGEFFVSHADLSLKGLPQ